jgi:BMFP domain-containing protein YqiC
VREVSEEQEARWRGLIQHVQSGAERNFATFADAVKFMQGRVIENTIQTLEKGEQMTDSNPFGDLASEMVKMWGDFGPQMFEMWSQTAEQMMGQSMAFRSQIDQAVTTALNAWGLPTRADQDAVLTSLAQLGEQVDQLMARVEALESQLVTQQAAPKRRRITKPATAEEE